MNAKRRKFAHEYVRNGFNGVQAIFAAGYKQEYNSACTEAWRMLRNAEVAAVIEQDIERAKLSADEVLEELTSIAKTPIEKPSESAKMKALELLGKGHKLFGDRVILTTEEHDELTDNAAQKLGLPIPVVKDETEAPVS